MALTRAARLTTVLSVAMLAVVGMQGPVASRPNPSTPTCVTPPTDLCADYVSRGRRWPSGPVLYYINLSGAPAGAEQDVQDAFAAWEQEQKSAQVEAAFPGDRSSIDFTYAGTTMSGGGRDGRNVVHFNATSGTAAVSLVAKGSTLVEFDIVFNRNFGWVTDETCPAHDCGRPDLQNAATHEVGHVLDLYHVSAEGAAQLTMFPYPADSSRRPSDWSDETAKRDLGAGEVLGLRKAYPL